jgi:hypothetical protein
MVALWILAVIAWSLLPYRQISVWVFGGEGFNLGDLFLLAVAVPVIGRYRTWRTRSPFCVWILVLWGITLICALKGIVAGESVREIGRVLRGSAFWLIVPAMVTALRTPQEFRDWVRGMGVIVAFAALSLLAFSFDPALIPTGEETGTFRDESYAGFERVFTLGMWSVFAGSIFLVARLLLEPSSRIGSALTLFLLFGGLAVTFARTFFVGVLLGTTILLFFLNRRAASVLAAAAVCAGLLGLAGFAPDLPDLAGAVTERLLDLVTAAPEAAWQTFLWRVAEAETALSSLQTTGDLLFGALGRVYSLEDGYTASVPHIGFSALLYSFGLVGGALHALVLGIATVRTASAAVRSRGTPWFWLSAGAFAAWIALLAAAFAAPVFHLAWGTATLALTVGISETTRQFLPPTAHVPSHHNDRHSVHERGASPHGDRGERAPAGLSSV